MSTARWFLAIGLVLSLAMRAEAADVVKVQDGLLLRGDIVRGDLQRVKSAFAAHGNQLFHLNSPGGSVAEALDIAEYLRGAKSNTNLPQKAECASACVLIFAGGVVRTSHQSARLGVHMGSGLLNDRAIARMHAIYAKHGPAGVAYVGSIAEQAAANSTLRQVNFFLSAGISLRLLQLAAAVDHLDIRWLTYSEAKDFNLINTE